MNGFYAPPELAPDRHAGQLLRLRRTSVARRLTASAWRVLYVSANSYGELVPASGLVLVPDTINILGAGPMLVYCPGFHGLGGECAPSQLLVAGYDSLEEVGAGLDRGWTVVVPDGENLGVTGRGPHTFLAARAAGQIALDLARAAQRIPELYSDSHLTPVVLWGYADGGRAVVRAAELVQRYAPELDVRGVAAGAVVTDPPALVRHLDGGPWSALGLAGLIGLSQAYHHLPLRQVLTEDGRRVAAAAGGLSAAELLEQYRQPLGHWCEREDPWNDSGWRFVLARESGNDPRAAMAPVHFFHGTRDSVVPVEFGRDLYTDYRSHGAACSWREYDADHFATATEAIPEVLARLSEHLTRSREDTLGELEGR